MYVLEKVLCVLRASPTHQLVTMGTDFRYILQPVEAAQEGFLLHVCLSFHSYTLLVC